MTVTTRLIASCAIAAGTVLVVQHGVNALHASLPKDMPANAQFLQSGYDVARGEPKGEWIACHSDPAQNADFCRVTDAHGVVIYQGDFVSVAGSHALPDRYLNVAAKAEEQDLWIPGANQDGPVPVIPLANGDVLAPITDQPALAARWSNDPDQLRRVEGRF